MRYYIGLGANLGNQVETLRQAVTELSKLGTITAVAGLYRSAPVGYTDQPWFYNSVVELDSDLEPLELLHECQRIETELGRVRTIRFGPRTLDIDLLLTGEQVLDTPELQIPHPRMHQRRFVLVPLSEIAPELVHPIAHRTMSELRRDLDPVAQEQPLETLAHDWLTGPA